MWVLLISLYLPDSLGQTQSKGMIHAPQPSLERCSREQARVRATWYMDGYQVRARCIYIRHYSNHNGAYNEQSK